MENELYTQQLEDLWHKLHTEFGVNVASNTGTLSRIFYSVRNTPLLDVVRFFEQPNYHYSHETHDGFADTYYYVNIIAGFKVSITYWHSEVLNPNKSVAIYIGRGK